MERGNAVDFKNKSLDEIDINMEYIEEEPDAFNKKVSISEVEKGKQFVKSRSSSFV